MKVLEICGGKPLVGEVAIGGAKNSSMPIIIASMLSKKQNIIHNVPHVLDVTNLLSILTTLGVEVSIDGHHTNNPSKSVGLWAKEVGSEILDVEVTSKIRTSILLLGVILARNGYVKLAKPGGCDIGERKIDLHIMAMEKLGAKVVETDNFVEAKAPNGGLVGGIVEFPSISVGATENVLMASVLAKGETILKNVATEPEIDDLINFLNQIGAKIEKTGERELKIQGIVELSGNEYGIISDRIEVATYAILAGITNGEIKMYHCNFQDFWHIGSILQKVGIEIEGFKENGIVGIVARKSKNGFSAIEIETNPYPLCPTDIQPQLMSLLALVGGRSVIVENIFENRLSHAFELQKMGAKIEVWANKAIIDGVSEFVSATVRSSDLRAGAALVIAACACKGKVFIEKAELIDRGYQMVVKNLKRLGCDIKVYYN